MDNRADNVRQKASTRKFVHNLTETAGKKALNIIEEASQDASSKTKQAMTMSQKIRLKAQKEVAEMMKMEEEQMKASTKLAEEEINRRWELEKKQMATLRRQMLQEAKERKSMEDAEREERIVMEKELIQTMKDNATREITDFRRKTVQEVEQMRKEAKEERERMLAQQLVEQQLFRDRAEEAKETLLKQTRWEMKVVMERVHEQAEVKKAAAEEEVKAILSRGHEQVRIAQSQYHQNVRVLEAMDSFKRTVTVEISKKLELENQRKEAKQKMEEAAIKRQRAEASLRAKQDAIKKKEKQLKESRGGLFKFLQLRVENANLTKEISTVFEVDNRNSFTSPSPRTDLGQKTEPVRMKPLDKQKPHPAFELLNKLFKISAFDRTEYVALKRLFAQKNKRVIRAYKKYLKKRKLRILTARFRRILATEDKENAVEAQIKKAKEDAENYKTREQLMDAYMGAVKKQNKPMIQISRGMLISAPIVPSFDIEAENRLNNLIERRKATKKTKTVPRHVVEKTLVQVNNLKASQIRERTSAEIADWAIKVGVEAKLLKSSMKKKEGLWDWRGRIEHDKIELQVHDAYIDYLHGKVSKFWMEVQ
eukprot:g92.t1